MGTNIVENSQVCISVRFTVLFIRNASPYDTDFNLFIGRVLLSGGYPDIRISCPISNKMKTKTIKNYTKKSCTGK